MELLLKSSASVHIYIHMFKKRISWDYLLPLLKSIWTTPTSEDYSKEWCVLVRDIIISILPIIWLMFIEIMLFHGSHTSSYPKLMNKGREGKEGGSHRLWCCWTIFPRVIMIWCWRDDTCSDFMGRGALQAWARRAGAVIFQCLYPVTSEQCLVHQGTWKLSV